MVYQRARPDENRPRGLTKKETAEWVCEKAIPINTNGCFTTHLHPKHRSNPGSFAIAFQGKRMRVHHLVYQVHTGDPVRKGQRLIRTCGNVTCINPVHMEKQEKGIKVMRKTSWTDAIEVA